MASRFFFKPFVTNPLAPFTTGIITHFTLHISYTCISVHKLLYFTLFSASFCVTFQSAGVATSISMYVFSFSFYLLHVTYLS
jgi:hypothetical protein